MNNRILFRPFVLLFALLVGAGVNAQQIVIRIGTHPGSTAGMLNNWTPTSSAAASSVASEAPYYVQEIMNTVGLKPNFKVQAARIDNAAAVIYGGQRYILYNPTFIDELVQRTGNKWAAVSVLAHEIGHHLDGHTVTSAGSQPELELEADEFSGLVLHRMGASLADAQAAMRTIASDAATRTHPGRSDRLTAIARGWNKVSGPGETTDIARVMQQPLPAPAQGGTAQAPSRTSTVRSSTVRGNSGGLSDRNILGVLTFTNDPRAQYYVTTGYNVVKVQPNGLQVLGKLARSNSSNYPYVIYDDQTKLLVHTSGAVVSQSGRTVGKLTPRA
ncbi:membrane-binding protein [Flaviaesturariibacter flavus]|uniref:Membrane-binding protein n=1 Tax=Flaviaesturariibacter flavus TaxID=2502780 RepID=A0A4R1BH66_9BACT|nr:M48 family metalloprotease [Flaviaesturariibacter flavus]TCJ16553.1 membrane-binding protein [Flaviaesturariibacter flavus]